MSIFHLLTYDAMLNVSARSMSLVHDHNNVLFYPLALGNYLDIISKQVEALVQP